MCGRNYYNAVVQFLQAEKTIRLRSLVKMGYDMNEIRSIFTKVRSTESLVQQQEIDSFVVNLESFLFTDEKLIARVDKNLSYYLAGYIAESLDK